MLQKEEKKSVLIKKKEKKCKATPEAACVLFDLNSS